MKQSIITKALKPKAKKAKLKVGTTVAGKYGRFGSTRSKIKKGQKIKGFKKAGFMQVMRKGKPVSIFSKEVLLGKRFNK